VKCFYHKTDFDGVCSAAIIKHFFPDCEMYPITHGEEFPIEIINDDKEIVFMVDYCLQPFRQMELLRLACNLNWIDHHSSAIEAHKKSGLHITGMREVGKGACELVWEFLQPGKEMPLAIKLLGRYDVWDFTDENVLPFQYGLRSMKDMMNPENQRWVFLLEDDRWDDNVLKSIVRDGQTVLRYVEINDEKYINRYAFEGTFLDYNAIFCNIGGGSMKVFDSIYDHDRHQIMVKFVRTAKSWTVSLYTKFDDIDCGAIAKSLGGGGHPRAAGLQCKDLSELISPW